jgi:two-component system sensor histidine kinase PilS (NtrC family)
MTVPKDRHVRWLIALRLLAITSLSAPYALWMLIEENVPRVEGFHLFAGSVYVASLIYIVADRILQGRTVAQAYFQLCGDVLLITGLLYLYGGVSSPFSMLYLVVIAAAASLLGRRGAIALAGFAYLLYAALAVAFNFDFLSSLAGAGIVPLSPGLLIYNLATHFVGFIAVALLTSYLAERATTTEERLARETASLEALQLEHRDVVESMTSGLLTTDLEGIVVSVNRAGLEILGDGSATAVGRPLAELGLLDAAGFREASDTANRSDAPERRANTEVERPLSNGSKQVLGLSISALRDAGGQHRGFIVTFRDLTELRRLQDELRLRDRMAAVGELAAGLAHEIGNPLAAISGSVQLLQAQSQLDPSRRRLLDIVAKESERLDRTIKGFLRFARPRDRSTVAFDIARLLQENLQLLRNSAELKAGHRIEHRFEPESFQIIADPDQISQIFWNLVRNALKAMSESGVLQIEGVATGGSYRLRVSDDGQGMTAEEKADLFQPFRSGHKRSGGMGMAIVYRIVHEHGGTISVDSRPGGGTRIDVEFPVGTASGAIAAAGGRA